LQDVICPVCGERNPERARFCLRCGSSLTAPARREEERKLVTVLFCDLVGFTARSDRADPEDVKATLRPYHSAISRVFDGFGATLDKFVGDGVVGVFGAPSAHEDDAERAIRAAFRIQQEIAQLNDGSAERPLAVRIGIDTGEAVVAVGPGPQVGERVTGEVLTLAARLQALAPVGGIAVGDATRRAAKDRFEYEGLETSGSLRAWVPSELSRFVREQPNTPFVGRGEEAALLRATFRRAASEPSVQLVTVVGEPGVGKSRLIQEFAGFLDGQPDLIRWRQGRCLPYGDGVGFWPLSEIVKTEAGILESDGPEEAHRKLARSVETVIEDATERDWILARIAPLAGVGEIAAASDRDESFSAWRRYLEGMASQHPLVVVVEDLHWADAALFEFLDHVLERTSGLPMLILCAARTELFDRAPGWAGGKRNAVSITIPPLSESETAMLISGLLDQAVLPAETQRTLIDRAGGNPLYTEEFVRMLVDRGVLDPATRALRLAAGDAIPVPESIQAILGARLDTLPFETKNLLQDASVIGRTFWAGALAAMSGVDVDDVRSRLRECARLELVRTMRSSSVEGDEEYAFWHILIRDVAYAQLPRAERAVKHRAFADWLATVAGSRLADQAEVLAHHYGEAMELAGSTGADTEELRALTMRYLVMAAERAQRVDARSAERHLLRAVALTTAGSPERARALVVLGDVETSAGSAAAAREHFDEAIEIYRAVPDHRVRLGGALALKTRALDRLGRMQDGARHLEEAIAILEAEGPTPELAHAYSRMASHQLMLGRFDRCRDFAVRALELAERFGLDDEIVRARQNLGAARCELGDAAGLADLWQALREGLDRGIGVGTAVTYGNLAWQLWILDGPAMALQVWDAAVEFCAVRGFVSEGMLATAGQIETLFDLGRWDEVVQKALPIEAWDREEGGGQMRAFAEVYRATVLARRGDLPAAILLEEEFLPRVRSLGRVEFWAPALATAVMLEHRRGHDAIADDLIDEYVRVTTEHDTFRLQFLPDVARVLAAHGRTDLLASLARETDRVRNPRARWALASVGAIETEARGDHAEAARRYAEVAAAWLAYGSVPERAEARFGHGRSLAAIGDPGAEDAFRDARALFEQLGATPSVADVDRALDEIADVAAV
jgi:class 3 adenylate cyclase/tetratricopeptide (TPR) repeat protein